MRERVNEYDYLKSVFITLMVVFHLAYFGDSHPYAKAIVYTFHMPAFLVLSGFLANVGKDRRSMGRQFLWLFVPYAVMEAAYAAATCVMDVRGGIGELSARSLAVAVLARPVGPYWYLHTLMLCLAAYVALNLGYSFGLKHVPIADIAILAAGYIIRVLYGSCLTGIDISAWMYLTVLSLSFYLGLGKRKGELDAAGGGPVRPVVEKYPAEFLSSNMTVFFALGLVFYSLWATDAGTVARTSGGMVLTIPIVFLICLRYSLVLGREGQGDPIEVVLGDRALMALLAVFAAAVLVIIYAG